MNSMKGALSLHTLPVLKVLRDGFTFSKLRIQQLHSDYMCRGVDHPSQCLVP